LNKITFLWTILILCFTSFSFGQEREPLDSVYLSNRQLTADEIILRVKENISTNYFVDTLNLTIKKEFIQKLNYLDFDIDNKKIKLIPKNRRAEFEKEISGFTKKTKNSRSMYSYKNTFSFQQERLKKPSVSPILKSNITSSETKIRNLPQLINEFEAILEKYIDKEENFTIKTGIFPIERGLALDGNTMNNMEEKNQIFDEYSWPKEKIINPGIHEFLSDVEAYDYMIEKTFIYRDQLVYNIIFKPKKNRAKLTGFCIISAENFAILKAKYDLAEGEKTWGVNFKFPLGVKVRHNIFSGEFAYKKINSGKYIPEYYHFSKGEYTYLHRNLLIKTQNGFLKRSDKLKIDLLLESQEVTTESFTFSSL